MASSWLQVEEQLLERTSPNQQKKVYSLIVALNSTQLKTTTDEITTVLVSSRRLHHLNVSASTGSTGCSSAHIHKHSPNDVCAVGAPSTIWDN